MVRLLTLWVAFAAPHIAVAQQTGWFHDLVSLSAAEVTKRHPPQKDQPQWALIEACGGIGPGDDGRAPGACASGPMRDATEIKYVRLVFTPLNHTAPTVLVFHNVTTNSSAYQYSPAFWIGDNQAITDWNASLSLENAHSRFSGVAGNNFYTFTWRATLYKCVFEPVFIFSMSNGTDLFVGAYAKKVCHTPTMNGNSTLGCVPHCYDREGSGSERPVSSIVL